MEQSEIRQGNSKMSEQEGLEHSRLRREQGGEFCQPQPLSPS